MPLQIPSLDNRRYQDLLDEALRRIPVHNPEWTNFNESDPGVTLIQVFAFLTENLLYRSNQIPERNRRKFLSLLNVPLQPASSASGIVTFTNKTGPLATITLNHDLEVRAGQVPFRTEKGLDVLPIEAQVYYKRPLLNPDPKLVEYYQLLYASYQQPSAVTPQDLLLYETVALDTSDTQRVGGVSLSQDTIGGSLWIALLARTGDDPEKVRDAIAGKTISLGVAPALDDPTKQLSPTGIANPQGESLLQYKIPNVPADGVLPTDPQQRFPAYKALEVRAPTDVLAMPGVVEITLPTAPELRLWTNLDPLEAGVGDFPPALDDVKLNERLITWLRIQASATVRTRILWVGINAVFVKQRAHVANELLPRGTGVPDQAAVLSQTSILPGSVRLTVTPPAGNAEVWTEVEDLFSAGPEVQVEDLRMPPGMKKTDSRPSAVFLVNSEAGEIKFGDGFRGKRPPAGAILRVSYDYSVGAAGNVGTGSINGGPALPTGFTVTNPIRTWNGAAAESVSEGEKQIARYLQHRDRLVSAADFEAITMRTPGVAIGRVEVLPAFNPELSPSEPGDAPGAVTLMIIPRHDPRQVTPPLPDQLLLNTVCRYLDSRRLVTTEVFLRGPVYKSIWISVGINVIAGSTVSIAEVREAVKTALLQFLAPVNPARMGVLEDQVTLLNTPQYAEVQKGWPLRKPVTDRELLAVASRQAGVRLVTDVKIAEGAKAPTAQIPMTGLELPWVAGLSVAVGEPLDLDQVRGLGAGGGTGTPSPDGPPPPRIVPVPVVPEEC